MSENSGINIPPKSKKSKLQFIMSALLLITGAGGGFAVVSLGLIGGTNNSTSPNETHSTAPILGNEAIAFVPLDPMLVSIKDGANNRILRFVAQLEVNPDAVREVENIRPRIVDILNGYLRALEIEDLEAPAALMKIRSQMLHRVRIVAGENRINDLLVMEFVIN
jgi:flagellar FliL protein